MVLLEGINVLDLSHRLPGPLATHILSELGAKVIKVEDLEFGDPFKDGFFKEMDPSFSNWYEALNKHKEIKTIDFKADSFKEVLYQLIDSADIILLGLPLKLIQKFSLEDKDLQQNFKEKAFLKMAGSRHQSGGMHDLNVLAKLGLLDLYLSQENSAPILAPPFLPIGGISYGSHLASAALAALLKARSHKTSLIELVTLEEAVQRTLSPFFNQELKDTQQRKFLHNGRYPCYNLYRLKDRGALAIASLEPKYWQRLCETLELNLSLEDRFHYQDQRVFHLLAQKAQELSYDKALALFKNKDCCVDIVAI